MSDWRAQEGGCLRADFAFSQLVRDIDQAIATGVLKPGDRLPSEVQLRQQYGISINSIRRGMEQLSRRGAVRRLRGSGTYVQAAAAPVCQEQTDVRTILLANVIEHFSTHPFFGARKRALTARLIDLGWRTETLLATSDETQDGERKPVIWHTLNMPMLMRQLDPSNRRLAGVVFDRATVEPGTAFLKNRLPCVSLTSTPLCPFVEYSWDDEVARAIHLAADAGAKRIYAFGPRKPSDPSLVRDTATIAARGGSLNYVMLRSHGPHSQLMHESCMAAARVFRTHLKDVDGVVIEDDIHAQGVFDALAECSAARVSALRVVALINRESRIHTAIPFTALVADGAVAGTLLAELLNDLLTEPERAPTSVYLQCVIRLAQGWPRQLLQSSDHTAD